MPLVSPERPEQICLGPASSVWALDLVQERFRNVSPGGFESTFLKAGDIETEEGLRVEEATGERLGGALLWHPRWVIGKTRARAGPLLAHQKGKVTVMEASQGGAAVSSLGRQGNGGLGVEVSPERAAAAHCSPGYKSHEDP